MFKSQYPLRAPMNEPNLAAPGLGGSNVCGCVSFGDILKRLSTPNNLTKQQYLSSLNELSRTCRSKRSEDLFRTNTSTHVNNNFFHKKTTDTPITNNLAQSNNHIDSDTKTTPSTTTTNNTPTPTNTTTDAPSTTNHTTQATKSQTQQQEQFTLDDVFRFLKNALFHEAAEVRAAALRAIRYLLKDEAAVQSLLRVNLPIFIVRSIDIVLENRTERIQALRLVRKFLSISPHSFPSAFTRSLIAIAQDGQAEHDALTRACWALLAELSIMSPMSSTRDTQNCAFNAIMDAGLAGSQPHGMCESLISTLLYMLNWPKYRALIRGDLDLQIFVAPFTDSHYTAPVGKDSKQRTNQATKFDVDPYDQRENKFTAAKITLISILRSWQGLIYLCEPQANECNLVSNSCLKSLINMLYLPYNEVRRRLIDLIFELLYLPLPDSLTDFESGLKFLEKHQLSMDSWKIHDAFVVDEAKALLLPLRTRTRMNLVDNYMALLLVALFHCNVVDALSEVIISPSNQENSIRATILLYQLLSLSYHHLPTDAFSQYLTLSTLIYHATSKVDDSRDLANAALINLGRVKPVKKSSKFARTKCSSFLGQILEFCSAHATSANGVLNLNSAKNSPTSCGMSTTSTMTSLSNNSASNSSSASTVVNQKSTRSPSLSSKTNSLLSRSTSMSAATSHLLTLLQIPSSSKSGIMTNLEQDWQLWDWEQINFLLTRPTDMMKKLSSQQHKAFIRRLVHFFKPSSCQYSMIDVSNERCRQLCETGCNMVDFLVGSPDPKATELLNELLHDILISMHDPEAHNSNANHSNSTTTNNLYSSASKKPGKLTHVIPHPDTNILSSSKLIHTMSSTYFLFIGRLSNTLRGYQMLEKSTIMDLINNLTQTSMLATSPAEVYVRLIISCLDYTKAFNGSRRLLEKFLFHHPEESVRIYATNFLRVLLRANVPDFSNWAIELLVRQLDSPLRVVHNAAADILDEACDYEPHLEGLINLKQVVDLSNKPKNVLDILRASGDSGYLLLCRIASTPAGLRYLLEAPRRRLSGPLDTVLNPATSKSVSNENLNQKVKANKTVHTTDSPSVCTNSDTVSSNILHKSLPPSIESLTITESEFSFEIDRWQRVFNYRYVKIVEDVLNNSLTYHQKGDDGKYGRRIDRINPMTKNSYLPAHLYGQLALHPDGIDIMKERKLLEPVYDMLHKPPSDLNDSEVSLLKYKAALWIVGNVGSSESGYQVLTDTRELIRLIVGVAKSAAVLSLRGTAFYILGLLGKTNEGAEEISEHGWIVKNNNMVALPLDLGLILTKPQDYFVDQDERPQTASAMQQDVCNANNFAPGAANNKSQSPNPSTSTSSFSSTSTSSPTRRQEISSNKTKLMHANSAGANDVRSDMPRSTIESTIAALNQSDNIHPVLRENFSKQQLEQIRRDVLKDVTNLSHSVASRPAENSLLNMKRKYGLVFQYDLGLYSEVCQQLAKYNFRLHARRFLQELFLDIT